ncbi:MAG: HD domain-containing phosphohydrolase [Acidiferrobacterales bacterium]
MPSVMIIDDVPTTRIILAQLMSLLEMDMRVETFDEPVSALDYVQDHEPDLVLADFRMPRMNGVEFTRLFRQLYKDIPLVMITGSQDRHVLYDALNAGANDYLSKPVDHAECLARCRNLLTMRKLNQIHKEHSRWLEERVTEATREISRREQETLMRLAKAGEYRDAETGNHVERMAKYAGIIGRRMGLSDSETRLIELAAPMHDIGKIGIPDHILRKSGKLDPQEFEIMKTHTRIGHEILKNSPSMYLQMGAVIALGHHEKYDGTGYPSGLVGEAVPLPARIVAVADVFDALTSVRPYKMAWPIDDAYSLIHSLSGEHFDPRCVSAFEGEIEQIVRIRQLLQDPPQE